jgi:hypothetical protein
VDPRSQQLLDAYQQAETYQHSAAGTAPDLRVPDYTSQQQGTPYDDPFGHPQQPFATPQHPFATPQGQYEPPQGQYEPPQGQYEPQPGQYEPQPYRPSHQAPAQAPAQAPSQPPAQTPPQTQQAWDSGESTVKLDPSMFHGDALGAQPPSPGEAPGPDAVDPTAIYTPNEPRR